MSPNFKLDTSLPPLVVITISANPSLEEIEAGMAAYKQAILRDAHYASIFDLSGLEKLGDPQRGHVVDWIRTNRILIANRCVALGCVLPTVLQRMLARSVFMLSRTPAPVKVFSQLTDAKTYCHQQLVINHIDQAQ